MVYNDVVEQGLILPKKEKYTRRDFDKLVKSGIKPSLARFICICSSVYYDVEYSKVFDSLQMRLECRIS